MTQLRSGAIPFALGFRRTAHVRLCMAGVVILTAAGPVHAADDPPALAVVGRTLSLSDAQRLAVSSNLSLAEQRSIVEAARSRIGDAGRWSNPQIYGGAENFGGSLGSSRTEWTIGAQQSIALGGDRKARGGTARSDHSGTQATLARVERDILALATDQFLGAWIEQENTSRLHRAERIAAEAVQASEQRLNIGAAPAHEVTRARSYQMLRTLEREQAESRARIARRNLASTWGSRDVTFDSLMLAAPELTPPVTIDTLLTRLDAHPELLEARAAVDVEGWRIRQVEAARVPDVAVDAGVRRLDEVGESGFIAGVSAPLPLWNRQSGELAAARAMHQAAQERVRRVALALRTDVSARHDELVQAIETFERLDREVLPSTRSSLEAMGDMFRSGRLSYLELQEGERALLEAELAWTAAYADVWGARSAIERMIMPATGTTLTEREKR